MTNPIPIDPIVLPDKHNGAVPLLLRFARRPEISVPKERMGNVTYNGTTSAPDGEYSDNSNDDI